MTVHLISWRIFKWLKENITDSHHHICPHTIYKPTLPAAHLAPGELSVIRSKVSFIPRALHSSSFYIAKNIFQQFSHLSSNTFFSPFPAGSFSSACKQVITCLPTWPHFSSSISIHLICAPLFTSWISVMAFYLIFLHVSLSPYTIYSQQGSQKLPFKTEARSCASYSEILTGFPPPTPHVTQSKPSSSHVPDRVSHNLPTPHSPDLSDLLDHCCPHWSFCSSYNCLLLSLHLSNWRLWRLLCLLFPSWKWNSIMWLTFPYLIQVFAQVFFSKTCPNHLI